KDAFENGILALYEKSKKNKLIIKGSLKTTVYSFGLLQLLAFYKKDKLVFGTSDYIDCSDLLFDNDFSQKERHAFLNDRENDLIEALANLSEKQREILSLKFFHNLKSKEIAQKLNVTVGNIDNASVKAYKKLRQILLNKT
ncbi:MAG TPA: sigma-70 family RNA polymerase sigma factor, partial [Segetibacter sp.]|nr:sigma-70 family RNA polymerase sigma factor [Segetibacter sp.]